MATSEQTPPTCLGLSTPDAYASRRDHQELVQQIRVRGQDMRQADKLHGEFCRRKAEIEHAGVRLLQAKDQIAEVAVVSDEHALFSMSDRKDLGI
jgi:hypothetical protein